MKVAIYSRGIDQDLKAQLVILLNELKQHNTTILLLESLAANNPDIDSTGISIFSKSSELDDTVDCLISLGGDGTILDSVTLIRDENIPILGINL